MAVGAAVENSSSRPSSPGRPVLTGRGRSFITVGAVSLLAGLIFGVPDLERAGVLLLALPVPAWLLVSRARGGLLVSHVAQPPRVEAGQAVDIKLSLANPASLGTGPLRVTESVPGGRVLRFSLAGVKAGQRRTVTYPLTGLTRGHHALGPTTVVAGDPFGLVSVENVSAATTELVVHPNADQLPAVRLPAAWREGAATMSNSIGLGGSDDASVREWRHGDDHRKIHWRSTARSGRTMVRQEERPWLGDSLVLLDTRRGAWGLTGAGDESDSFEWAVSAAASISLHLLHRRRPVTAVTGSGAVAGNSADAILDLFAAAVPDRRAGAATLASAVQSLGQNSTVYAIISATDSGQFCELLAQQRGSRGGVAFVVDANRWTNRAAAASASEDAQLASQVLRAAGWQVVRAGGGAHLAELWQKATGAVSV